MRLTDEVGQLQGAHRMVCAKLHSLVNVLCGTHSLSPHTRDMFIEHYVLSILHIQACNWNPLLSGI